jgi:hypothetical protein
MANRTHQGRQMVEHLATGHGVDEQEAWSKSLNELRLLHHELHPWEQRTSLEHLNSANGDAMTRKCGVCGAPGERVELPQSPGNFADRCDFHKPTGVSHVDRRR